MYLHGLGEQFFGLRVAAESFLDRRLIFRHRRKDRVDRRAGLGRPLDRRCMIKHGQPRARKD